MAHIAASSVAQAVGVGVGEPADAVHAILGLKGTVIYSRLFYLKDGCTFRHSKYVTSPTKGPMKYSFLWMQK